MNVSNRLKVEGWIHSNRGLENALRFIFVTWQKSSASAQLIGEAVCRNARSDFCKYQLETCVAGINHVWNPHQNFERKKNKSMSNTMDWALVLTVHFDPFLNICHGWQLNICDSHININLPVLTKPIHYWLAPCPGQGCSEPARGLRSIGFKSKSYRFILISHITSFFVWGL